MADIYLSPSGNDGSGDGSYGNPYLTLAHCVSVASVGDVIIHKTGTYNISSDTAVIVSGHTLTIRSETGNPNDCMYLGGGTQSYYFKIVSGSACSITISGIKFKNFNTNRYSGGWYCFLGSAGAGVPNETWTISKCIFEDITFSENVASVCSIADNHSPTGSTMRITSCIFNRCESAAGYGAIAMCIRNGNILYFYNNIVYISSGHTLYNCLWVAYGEIKNNIFYNDGSSMPMEYYSIPFDYNIYYGAFTSIPSGTGNQNIDPNFISKSNGIFSLRQDSSINDAGIII